MNKLTPERKVWVGGVSGALLVLALKILKHYGIEFSGDEVAQLLVLATFAVQWLVPNADAGQDSITTQEPPSA